MVFEKIIENKQFMKSIEILVAYLIKYKYDQKSNTNVLLNDETNLIPFFFSDNNLFTKFPFWLF